MVAMFKNTDETENNEGFLFSKPKGTLYHAFLRKATDKVVLLDDTDSLDGEEDELTPQYVSQDFLSRWTVHGPSHIVTSRFWISRVIWFVLWLCAVIYCFLQCYRVVVLYYTYPKIVTVELVETENITFPAVTFCSLNPFVLKEGNENHYSNLWHHFIHIEESNLHAECYNLTENLGYYDKYSDCYPPDCYYSDYDYTTYADYSEGTTFSEYGSSHYPSGSANPSPSENSPTTQTENDPTPQIENDFNSPPGNDYYSPSENDATPQIENDKYTPPGNNYYTPSENGTQIENYNYSSPENDFYSPSGNDPNSPSEYDPDSPSVYDLDSYSESDPNSPLKYTSPERTYTEEIPVTEPPLPSVRKRRETKKTHNKENINHQNRLTCSKTYQRIYYDNNPSELFDPNKRHVTTENCAYDTINEKINFDPVCSAPFITDIFGTYNTILRECDSKRAKGTSEICTNCCSREFICVPVEQYELLKQEKLTLKKLELLIKNSRTKDGIDLFGRFVEKPSDVKSVAVKINDFLVTCSFDGNPCSYNDFKRWMSDKYGYCYTYNADNFYRTDSSGKVSEIKSPVKLTHNVGPQNGLRITANLHSDKTLSFLSPEIGMKVIVHEPDILPFPEEEGITVLPGVISSVKVSLRRIVRQPSPVGKCEDSHVKGPYKYTTILCRKLCIDKQYRLLCNCTTAKSPAYDILDSGKYYRPCSLLDTPTQFCMEAVLFDYRTGSLKCNCPERCSEWEYQSTVSTSQANKKYYTILQNIKKQQIAHDVCSGGDNSTARVHVYVDHNSYEEIKELPAYSWETLLSNIGGNFGLFVGMSFISVLELMEYLLGMTVIVSTNKKEKLPKTLKKRTHVPVYLMFEPPTDFQKPSDRYQNINEYRINKRPKKPQVTFDEHISE